MKISDVLTIVLPLKGRPEYTKRFLEYSEWCQCPFKILIADGGNDNLQLKPKDFSGVNFEYIKYPYDERVVDYNLKMNDVLARVETPLTMMIDNDDFFCLNGMYHVINILHKHPNFHGGRGCLTRCCVKGKGFTPEKRRMHHNPSVLGKTALERVSNSIAYFHSHLHDIVRTPTLQITNEIIDMLCSNDLMIVIRLNVYLAIVHGQTYRNDDVTFIFHEDGTPRIKGQAQGLILDCDWIKKPYWNESFAKITSAVGASIAHVDNIDLEVAKRKFLEPFIQRFLDRKDPGHMIPHDNITLRNNLKNSIEDCIKRSEDLKIDEKIKNCLTKSRTNGFFQLDKELEVSNINDDLFRQHLTEYLKIRKYCL